MLSSALLLLTVAACATTGPPGDGINDPYEDVNRRIHGFNKGFDTVLVRPVSFAYGTIVPSIVRDGVQNIRFNLKAPQDALNDLLQGDIEDMGHNLFRFGINTTMGIAGIFDPATSMGLERRDTDFGETLFVWGVGEGAYISVPFFGPYTQRDAVGDLVDLFTDPFAPFVSYPQRWVPTATYILEQAGDRYDFADTIDAVLYESADSYAQTRIVYLENRRFKLGAVVEDAYVDPYDELFEE